VLKLSIQQFSKVPSGVQICVIQANLTPLRDVAMKSRNEFIPSIPVYMYKNIHIPNYTKTLPKRPETPNTFVGPMRPGAQDSLSPYSDTGSQAGTSFKLIQVLKFSRR